MNKNNKLWKKNKLYNGSGRDQIVNQSRSFLYMQKSI